MEYSVILQYDDEEKHTLCVPKRHIYTKTNIFSLTRKSQLHSIICNSKSVPDYLAINIYYDTLRSWHAPNKMKNINGEIVYISKLKTKGIYLSYKELAKTYGCSSETIRRKLVKLEKLGLIQRSYKHKKTVTTQSYNQLIIYVWKQTPYFYNRHGIKQSEVPALKPQTNHKYITEKYNIDYHSQVKEIKTIVNDRGIHKGEDTKELIEPFNKLKDRSRANFIKSSFSSFHAEKKSGFKSKNEDDRAHKSEGHKKNEKIKKGIQNLESINPEQIHLKLKNKEKDNDQKKESRALPTLNTNGFLGSGRYLHEILDYLTGEICSLIRAKCGKDFTNRAIREIARVVSRSKKGAKAFFYHIKGFIAYLAKILSFEKRDPVAISSTDYYITANQTNSEREMREQEKYLSDIEYSLEASPEWHLKKKIAAALQREKAYNILTSWKNLEITKAGIAKLSLTKLVLSTETDKKIILSQIKATHERMDDNENYQQVEFLELVMPNKPVLSTTTNTYQLEQNLLKRQGLWGKIRESFAKSFASGGDYLDKAWTSHLRAEIDNNNKTINLFAPTAFMSDWINSNYRDIIEKAAKDYGMTLQNIIYQNK